MIGEALSEISRTQASQLSERARALAAIHPPIPVAEAAAPSPIFELEGIGLARDGAGLKG